MEKLSCNSQTIEQPSSDNRQPETNKTIDKNTRQSAVNTQQSTPNNQQHTSTIDRHNRLSTPTPDKNHKNTTELKRPDCQQKPFSWAPTSKSSFGHNYIIYCKSVVQVQYICSICHRLETDSDSPTTL